MWTYALGAGLAFHRPDPVDAGRLTGEYVRVCGDHDGILRR